MNEELNLITTEEIQNLIYTIRGKQVMLDSDVANLYHYKIKRINEAVSRNKDRFPEGFCFQLTENEMESLRSQIATSSESNAGNLRSQFVISNKIKQMNFNEFLLLNNLQIYDINKEENVFLGTVLKKTKKGPSPKRQKEKHDGRFCAFTHTQ